MSHYKLRPYHHEDESFVFNSWLKSTREDFSTVSNSKFYATYKDHIKELLGKSKITIACDPEDSEFIYGYMVVQYAGDVPIIHWIYVKSPFRKVGLMKAMLETVVAELGTEPVIITYRKERQIKLYDKMKMIYKPEYRTFG